MDKGAYAPFAYAFMTVNRKVVRMPIAGLFRSRERPVGVKDFPLAVRQNHDDRLGKACGERSAVIHSRGSRTLACGERNGRRKYRDMLLVKLVVHLL